MKIGDLVRPRCLGHFDLPPDPVGLILRIWHMQVKVHWIRGGVDIYDTIMLEKVNDDKD